jgi:hydrogenase maturation protease
MLLLGYGNSLRGDDGIGCVLATLLQERLQLEWHRPLHVHIAHQLTPELVTEMAGVNVVIFLDAREGDGVGRVVCEKVQAQPQTAAFTHHVSPTALLEAARELHGVAPEGLLISVVGASFDYSDHLSPELSQRLPVLLDEVEQLIRLHMFAVED